MSERQQDTAGAFGLGMKAQRTGRTGAGRCAFCEVVVFPDGTVLSQRRIDAATVRSEPKHVLAPVVESQTWQGPLSTLAPDVPGVNLGLDWRQHDGNASARLERDDGAPISYSVLISHDTEESQEMLRALAVMHPLRHVGPWPGGGTPVTRISGRPLIATLLLTPDVSDDIRLGADIETCLAAAFFERQTRTPSAR